MEQYLSAILELGAVGVLGALFWLMMKHAAGRDIANRDLFKEEAKANREMFENQLAADRDATKENLEAERTHHDKEIQGLTAAFKEATNKNAETLEKTSEMMATRIEKAITESSLDIRKIVAGKAIGFGED